jgi:hypothetical protein
MSPTRRRPGARRFEGGATVRTTALLVVLAALGVAAGESIEEPTETPMVRIPGAVATVTDGAIVVSAGGREVIYVQGFGWLTDLDVPGPTVVDGEVYGAPELLHALGLDLPVVENIRFAGDAEIRIVLDVPGLEPGRLAHLHDEGEVDEGSVLALDLPSLLLPAGLPDVFRGLEVVLRQERDATRLELLQGPFSYRVFTLPEPTRLVIDVVPSRPLLGPETREALAPGVTYQRLRAEGSGGPTWVHLIEVAPDAGEWRVVGTSGEAHPMPRLADGAFAAINAGYFDTTTREAIGYLVVDGGVLSLPSRNRASVAFGGGAPVIDRVTVEYTVWVNGRVAAITGAAAGDGLTVVTSGWAGSARQGVITMDEDGVVLDNRVGPVRLEAGTKAVVYPPENRPLALADEGDAIRYQYRVDPSAMAEARYAVEAGPLLIKDGVPAFEPALESFALGQRILDGLTQQAALGVRADGTVLLVAAEAMVAGDLVELFLRLGARDAMRLDSGGSTTLMANGRVFNRRSERDVVSAIVLRLAER